MRQLYYQPGEWKTRPSRQKAGNLDVIRLVGLNDVRVIAYNIAPQDARLLDVRVGRLFGEWQDTYAGWEWNGIMPRRRERGISNFGKEALITLTQVWENPVSGASAGWTSQSLPAEWVGRLVAVDDAGVVHQPTVGAFLLQNAYRAGYSWQQETFKGLAASRIKQLRFQIRQCRWIEVRNISLQPGQRTQIGIVDAGDK